ncbi:MAG: hypothetical protein V8R55_01685 [Dysosmobacter sp.]
MMKLHSVEVKTLTPEIFRMFQVNTALLTAGDEEASQYHDHRLGPAGHAVEPAGVHGVCAAGAVYL